MLLGFFSKREKNILKNTFFFKDGEKMKELRKVILG